MDIARILVDFGLVVLTWIVQLVIYPGFRFFQRPDMLRWHKPYTRRITVIVFPLMAAQIGLYAYRLRIDATMLNGMLLLLVLMTWLITFFFAVPLHNRIESGKEMQITIDRLNRVHRWRTLIWTIIFLFSVGEFLHFI